MHKNVTVTCMDKSASFKQGKHQFVDGGTGTLFVKRNRDPLVILIWS